MCLLTFPSVHCAAPFAYTFRLDQSYRYRKNPSASAPNTLEMDTKKRRTGSSRTIHVRFL